ncbi:MAG: hypothetical protein IJ557_02730 [Bacteroidaceae bacterium]|nr:hypothetical protein [Bacteroidaceae bacterium]
MAKIREKLTAASRLRRDVERAQAEGYTPMPAASSGAGNGNEGGGVSFEMVLNSALQSTQSTMIGGVRPEMPIVASVLGQEQSTPEDVGSKGRGYIEWGAGNRLPNIISMLTGLMPYTATAAKFNVDVAAGMGFVPKYCYSTISNGALVAREIDYADAGVLLEEELLKARKELLVFLNTTAEPSSTDEGLLEQLAGTDEEPLQQLAGTGEREDKEKKTLRYQIVRTYMDRIERAEKNLQEWERTNSEVKEFLERNNLTLLALNLLNDMVLFGICFPELELSSNRIDQPDNAQWEPKVTGVSYRAAHTCRLEKMDDGGRIRYVYHSNRWLDQQNGEVATADIKALPALDPQHPVSSLDEGLREYRTAHRKDKADGRPTRWILPSYYPTAGRPYYPQPSWYSIFSGDIYPFLATIVSDRATRRKNKNIIGHIIYVHTDYLNKLVEQRKLELVQKDPRRVKGSPLTQNEHKQLIDEMWKSINAWITNRSNAGQSLLAYTFTGTDGKEHDAFRIVDVPNTSASDANAQKTELEEISAIVFFALQCHPELIGAVPGASGTRGGTYQRELYMLKMLQMAPVQQMAKKALDVTKHVNKWHNLRWVVKQQVLTTLDNSKTGMTEAEAK